VDEDDGDLSAAPILLQLEFIRVSLHSNKVYSACSRKCGIRRLHRMLDIEWKGYNGPACTCVMIPNTLSFI
jgi:hypothetical protein